MCHSKSIREFFNLKSLLGWEFMKTNKEVNMISNLFKSNGLKLISLIRFFVLNKICCTLVLAFFCQKVS
jgi:hypothetical protein